MNFTELKGLIGLTFRDPQQAARILIAQGWPLSARWMGLVLAISVSAILAYLSAQIFPAPDLGGEMAPVLNLTYTPMALAGMQLVAITLAAGLMSGVGRMFGGRGSFEDALLLTVWIEVMLLLVQVVQVLLSLVVPGVAGMLGIAAIAMFLWLTVQFTKELHGFTSNLKVTLGLFGTALAAGFLLSFIAAAFGLFPEVPQ
jgi:hypothetical protein